MVYVSGISTQPGGVFRVSAERLTDYPRPERRAPFRSRSAAAYFRHGLFLGETSHENPVLMPFPSFTLSPSLSVRLTVSETRFFSLYLVLAFRSAIRLGLCRYA